MQNIPDANSFKAPKKKGKLQKLTGRGWCFSGSWKERFCVLDGTKFYYYGSEKGSGKDKTSGAISLDYYDICEEFTAKDQKIQNVFVIGTSVRGFFDNRHQFGAGTKEDMQDWIRSIHEVMVDARNMRYRRSRLSSSNSHTDKMSPVSQNRIIITTQMDDELDDYEVIDENHAQLTNATKDRVRGPQGRRLPQRRSMMPVGSPTENDTQKQRSLSLSSPTETDENILSEENTISSHEQNRLSCSLDAMTEAQSHSLAPTNQTADSTPQMQKAIFARFGGQQSALTKELESKLKTGLVLGGTRFQSKHSTDDSDSRFQSENTVDIDELDRKIDSVQIKMTSLKNEVDRIQNKMTDVKASAEERVKNLQNELQEVLKNARKALEDLQSERAQYAEAIKESNKAKDDHRKLMEECREAFKLFVGHSYQDVKLEH